MRNNTQKEALDQSIANIIKKVETAGSWIKPFKAQIADGLPTNAKTTDEYKGMNVFNLWMSALDRGFSSSQWLTFNQCKDLKGTVKKGEKSTPIFFFKPLKVKDLDKEDGYKIIPMLKMYRVFNIEQTTLKAEPKEVTAENDNKSIQKAEDFYKALSFVPVQTAPKAFYSPFYDHIGIPTIDSFISSEEYYSTLGHEYIHSTGHKSRLDRHDKNTRNTEAYAYEELIAEIGSILLMAKLGLDSEPIQDNSAAYLKSWLKKLKEDPKYLWKASSEAYKAFTLLQEEASKK